MREANDPTYQDKQTTGFNRDRLVKLPKGWEWIRVGDLAMEDIQTGPFGAQLHRSDFVPFGVPVLAIGNVRWGYVDLDEIDHVTPEKAEQLQRYILHTGDVLFTRSGTVGRSAVLPQEADGYLMTGHILRIRLNPEFYLPELLFRAFQGEPTMVRQLQRHTRGMTRAGFNTSLLSSLLVPVPPPTEQRRIVAKIEALQERSRQARVALAEVGALLEQFRQSVLAAAFRGNLTADWRAAHPNVEPASELLHRIRAERRCRWEQAELARYAAKGQKPPENWLDKYEEPEPVDDSTLPELPNGWEWVRVRDVGEVQLGRQRSPQYHSGPNMRPYLRVMNVFEDRIDTEDVMEMDFSPEDFERYRLEPDDILLNEGQSRELVGRSAIYHGEVPGACFTNTLVRFRPHAPIESDYPQIVFLGYLKTRRFQQLASLTVNIAHLGAGRFADMEFPLPPLEEQTEIVRRARRALDQITRLEEKLHTTFADLDQLDQSILAKAFRGELVPQDPNDEPASVLLARIREQKVQQVEATKHKQKTSTTQRGNKTGKQSSLLTPQQLTLAEVLLAKD